MNESVAIVTGASQGIGQATAVRLARDFSAVALVARNRSNLERTAEAVQAVGAQALIIDVELMAFLVSRGAKWLTDATLRMDGGEVKSI